MVQFHRVTPRLPVESLPATVAFYTAVLDFTPAVLWPEDEPTFCILDRGQVSLGFFEAGSREGGGRPNGAEIYIDVSDVTRLHAKLKDRTPIEWGPEVYSYGRREFAVLDPDGYRIIFTEPTQDPPTCDEP